LEVGLVAMMCTSEATDRLRAAGMRLTPQRRAVIEALCGDTSHPMAEDVAASVESMVPGVSLSTVYKTLHEFAAVGLVKELDVPGAMRFDPDTAPHAHLVCDSCGSVVDVELPDGVVASLLAAAPDATIDRVEISLHGSCSSCAPS
jgi:Fur family transcriptional regulator, peroxide stress response regulator